MDRTRKAGWQEGAAARPLEPVRCYRLLIVTALFVALMALGLLYRSAMAPKLKAAPPPAVRTAAVRPA